MKSKLLILTVAAIGLLASCGKETAYTYAELGFLPISNGPVLVYADQTVDTVTVVATNSWELKANNSWITLDPAYSSRTQSGARTISTKCPILFETNRSGQVRYGSLQLSDGDNTVGRAYLQTFWLDIIEPAISIKHTKASSSYSIYDFDDISSISFQKTVPADSLTASVIFSIYAPSATLSTTASWIEPQSQEFRKGTHYVALSLQPNTTGNQREATLTLTTSTGISNDITLIQDK
ncbi:MAG: hypothetical protein IJ244_04990 [Bacteroidaceae bacterium]|nr:hypothetical protein [Bacteroidaceae bacterium]